ncbi:hypothetical protein ACDY96_27500 [Rhizobium mongolense]|uniref:hypothetical protein n=1 Tax=Rhizobium TaxID=379 RepID=UPI0024B03E42|nr:hypothetical protein [Rhizobium sp. CC1099]WFU91338.1 hypothetical protein QA644_24505 [Rhizobium sp. CC1099]
MLENKVNRQIIIWTTIIVAFLAHLLNQLFDLAPRNVQPFLVRPGEAETESRLLKKSVLTTRFSPVEVTSFPMDHRKSGFTRASLGVQVEGHFHSGSSYRYAEGKKPEFSLRNPARLLCLIENSANVRALLQLTRHVPTAPGRTSNWQTQQFASDFQDFASGC